MKKSRRAFLADLLFLGGGLTASAVLINSAGQGCGQVPASSHITQGVLALPDAKERLKDLEVRLDELKSLPSNVSETVVGPDVVFQRSLGSTGPGCRPTTRNRTSSL